MDEVERRIEIAEERIQNTEKVMTEMLKLQVKLEDKLMDLWDLWGAGGSGKGFTNDGYIRGKSALRVSN